MLSMLGVRSGTAGHEFQAPLPTDARSPCPFLNTMANHDYIRRDGRYITLWSATRGMMECYNFDFALALFVASAGIYTSLFTNVNPLWFDLSMLQVHNNISIEHDASLTRDDIKTGDNWHPDPELVRQMLSTSSSPDGSLSLEDYARYRVLREQTIPAPFTGARSFLATGEVGLILPGIGRDSPNAVDRKIHADWAKSFFLDAKLPTDWKPSTTPITLNDVNEVRKKMQQVMAAIRETNKAK